MWISKNVDLFTNTVVGLTFMFSGVVKLNDPLGFASKIEEYLNVFASQFNARFLLLVPYTLVLALFIATLEFVLGTSMIVHFQLKWTLSTLWMLTLFFTGLTFYTATSKHIASCGCFGDAFSLTPLQSFFKSGLLLCLLTWIYWQEIASSNATQSLTGYRWIASALLFAFGLSWYALNHLPVVDFSLYKVGNDLAQLTQPSAPLCYVYTVEKEGAVFETDHYAQEPGHKLLATRLANPEAMPAITDFNLWHEAKNCSAEVLTGNKLLIFVQSSIANQSPSFLKLNAFVKQLKGVVQPILITTSTNRAQDLAAALQISGYVAEVRLVKNIIKAHCGLLLLNNGVVVGKWHCNDLNRVQKALKKLDLL